MRPFAVFNLNDDRVRMPAHRGEAIGIWLVQICVTTTRGNLQTEIRSKQPCTFDDLRNQLLKTEINELFDDIEANPDERTVNACFTVYKLRDAASLNRHGDKRRAARKIAKAKSGAPPAGRST